MACRRDEAWSNGVLKTYINRNALDRREAALAARLCYGVLQNRLLLDFYLKQLLTGKLKDLHPVVRDVLHLGLYQLYQMDKIPDSAAVNEAVLLTKKYCPKQRNAAGLVNAVLRNAVRNQQTLEQPNSWDVIYSHPQKLIDMLESYVQKPRLKAMLQANNAIAQTVAQVNTLRIQTDALIERLQAEGVAAQPHKWMPNCLTLTGIGNLEQLPSFQEGLFYVQDCAAKLSVLCAQITPGSRVLDCCAAPGGKSFAAAIAMENTGHIISCDVYSHKTELIEKGAARLGLSIVHPICQDAAVFCEQWQQAMDVVIADVPCSGYGIIRKKPDIRYKDPEKMRDLPKLQRAILNNQAKYVKPGGVLIYSTCTLVREENEGVVEAFLSTHPEFVLERLPLPEQFPKNDNGMLVLVPGEYDTDGFFISRLRRCV